MSVAFLGAPTEGVHAATVVVNRTLRDPLIQRARTWVSAGKCFRELPLTMMDGGLLVEGVADLVSTKKPHG